MLGLEKMSLVLHWPWALTSLAAVAAAAFIAARRPLHRVVPVGSLRLWEKALAALGPSAARRARRLTAAWVALLAGAVLASVALSRPVLFGRKPARRISLALYPGAELGRTGRGALAQGARRLLGRLAPADRVRLLLPAVLGGATEPLSPAEAARRIGAHRLAGYYDVILDNPWETEQDTLQTARLLSRLPRPFGLAMSSLLFFPGTELCKDTMSTIDLNSYQANISIPLNWYKLNGTADGAIHYSEHYDTMKTVSLNETVSVLDWTFESLSAVIDSEIGIVEVDESIKNLYSFRW